MGSEASISSGILGPDPTTVEAYRVHPIVDPTKFWEGVLGGISSSNLAPIVNIYLTSPRRKIVTTSVKYMQMLWRRGRGSASDPFGGAYSQAP